MSTNHLSRPDGKWVGAVSIGWLGLAAVVAALVVLCDALSKKLVENQIGPGQARSSISLIGDFVELRYALNSGVAFGLLSGNSSLAGILVLVVVVPLVAVLAILACRGPHWAIASGLVLGGAFGNLIDRYGDQQVTDFVSVGRWPAFNLADAAITVGALSLILLSLREHRSPGAQGEAPAS